MRAALLIPPAFFVASTFACLADETSFSKGLERIAELGLPEMKGALWIKIPGDTESYFTSSYPFQEMNAKLSGNAWKLPTEPPTFLEFGSAMTLSSDQAEEQKSADEGSAKPGLLGKMLRNYQEKNPEPEKKPEAPEPVVSQAAKDAEKIVKALGKSSVAENISEGIEYGSYNLHGRLMLFAAQLQAAGETESANSLAAALFKVTENDAALIDGAISHLADTDYAAAANAFFETTDWEAYHTAVKALLVKFPRGWADAPAVALLASHLEKRAAAPPALSLPGIAIKPEALALIDKLLEKQTIKTSDEALAKARGMDLSQYRGGQRTEMINWLRANAGEGISFSDPSLWLLPSEDKKDDEPTSPIEALKAMRMDGFIALAAAVTDETLVPIRKQNDDSGGYYGSSESPAALIRRRYANLARPISRGEIAAALISSALPTPEDNSYSNSSEPDPADIAANAIEFWKTNKDKSAVELATLYIAEGSDNQRSFASNYLAASKDPAAHAAFEKTVLESNDPLSLIQAVEGYLDTRKAAAKPFATAYIKLIRDNPPSDDELQRSMVGYQIREAGGIENYLKKLSLKVGDVSLKSMITAALKAESAEDQRVSPIAALRTSIESIPFDECLITFGKFADVASPAQWMEIHGLLFGRTRGEQRTGDQDDGAGNFRVLPDNVMAIWKPQMSRTEALPEEGNFTLFARALGAKTMGDASTLLIEMASSPNLTYLYEHYSQVEGSSTALMEIARKRVAAWSSGNEPEPWPNEENVSEERQAEIAKKVSGLKAEEIIPYVNSLNRDERLAFYYMTQSYGDPEPIPPGILALRDTIVSFQPADAEDQDPEAAAKLGIAIGDRITAETLTRISDMLLADAAANSTTSVTFSPAPMGLGSTLSVTKLKDINPLVAQNTRIGSLARYFQHHENPEAMSFILVSSSVDLRVMKDGKPVTIKGDESALEDFAKTLESKVISSFYITISVLTREDAEKINNQDQ